MSGFRFPREGWKYGGSFSYGEADLYHDIPKVVVKVFPENEREIAEQTFRFLREGGVSTAAMEEIRHVDGTLHLYVFAERQEFLSHRDRLAPGLDVSS